MGIDQSHESGTTSVNADGEFTYSMGIDPSRDPFAAPDDDCDPDRKFMTRFFTDPTEENYRRILRFKDDAPEMKLYFGLIKRKYGFGDDLTEKEGEFLSSKETKLLSLETRLSPFDLDCLWAMFSATGDVRYPDRVKSTLDDPRIDTLTKGAAEWSYNSFIKQGLLNG